MVLPIIQFAANTAMYSGLQNSAQDVRECFAHNAFFVIIVVIIIRGDTHKSSSLEYLQCKL